MLWITETARPSGGKICFQGLLLSPSVNFLVLLLKKKMRNPRFSEAIPCVTLKCLLKPWKGIFVLGEKGRCVCSICSPRLIALSPVLHQNNAAGHNSVWTKWYCTGEMPFFPGFTFKGEFCPYKNWMFCTQLIRSELWAGTRELSTVLLSVWSHHQVLCFQPFLLQLQEEMRSWISDLTFSEPCFAEEFVSNLRGISFDSNWKLSEWQVFLLCALLVGQWTVRSILGFLSIKCGMETILSYNFIAIGACKSHSKQQK